MAAVTGGEVQVCEVHGIYFSFFFSQDVKLLSKDTWVQGTTWLAMGESKVLDLTIAPASAVRSPDVKHGLFISRKFKHKLEH